jgi:hypothetical protein
MDRKERKGKIDGPKVLSYAHLRVAMRSLYV